MVWSPKCHFTDSYSLDDVSPPTISSSISSLFSVLFSFRLMTNLFWKWNSLITPRYGERIVGLRRYLRYGSRYVMIWFFQLFFRKMRCEVGEEEEVDDARSTIAALWLSEKKVQVFVSDMNLWLTVHQGELQIISARDLPESLSCERFNDLRECWVSFLMLLLLLSDYRKAVW